MTLKMICLFCFVALLPFFVLGLPAIPANVQTLPIKLTIINDFTNDKISYSSSVVEAGVLFGVLNNLQVSNNGFSFNYSINDNYGLYLESVNGLAGSDDDHTYWQLLTETAGGTTPLDTGIGCYQPKKDEHIILKFTKY